jgi:hypothetical protein
MILNSSFILLPSLHLLLLARVPVGLSAFFFILGLTVTGCQPEPNSRDRKTKAAEPHLTSPA